MTRNLTIAAGAIAVLGVAVAAYAQPAPAPAAARPSGPSIPNVCIFSQERAVGTSTVGKQYANRMKTLQEQAQAELRAEAQAIDTELRALEAQRNSPTMTVEQLQQRALLLDQRRGALERKVQQRGRELQATDQKQMQRLGRELSPLVGQVYTERNCGLMLDRNVVFQANPQMDVTDAVVAKLNAKLTTLGDFPREPDPQAAPRPAAPGAAAPRPAAPAPAGKKK